MKLPSLDSIKEYLRLLPQDIPFSSDTSFCPFDCLFQNILGTNARFYTGYSQVQCGNEFILTSDEIKSIIFKIDTYDLDGCCGWNHWTPRKLLELIEEIAT